MLLGTAGQVWNLSFVLQVIVGNGDELSYNVVFCWIVTDWNGGDYGLERIHFNVLAMNGGKMVGTWRYGEIREEPVHLCIGEIRE